MTRTPKSASDHALATVIAAARQKGFQAEMLRQLDAMGLVVSRQELSQYLNADETRRRQPSFGTGLLLLRAAKRARKQIERQHQAVYGLPVKVTARD